MKYTKKYFLYIAWFIALTGMLMSLYFSEIAKLSPCILCWYQRIALYPLITIIPVGIITRDAKLPYYVLPLSVAGMLVALYHNLLYFHILPESIAPCTV